MSLQNQVVLKLEGKELWLTEATDYFRNKTVFDLAQWSKIKALKSFSKKELANLSERFVEEVESFTTFHVSQNGGGVFWCTAQAGARRDDALKMTHEESLYVQSRIEKALSAQNTAKELSKMLSREGLNAQEYGLGENPFKPYLSKIGKNQRFVEEKLFQVENMVENDCYALWSNQNNGFWMVNNAGTRFSASLGKATIYPSLEAAQKDLKTYNRGQGFVIVKLGVSLKGIELQNSLAEISPILQEMLSLKERKDLAKTLEEASISDLKKRLKELTGEESRERGAAPLPKRRI